MKNNEKRSKLLEIKRLLDGRFNACSKSKFFTLEMDEVYGDYLWIGAIGNTGLNYCGDRTAHYEIKFASNASEINVELHFEEEDYNKYKQLVDSILGFNHFKDLYKPYKKSPYILCAYKTIETINIDLINENVINKIITDLSNIDKCFGSHIELIRANR